MIDIESLEFSGLPEKRLKFVENANVLASGGFSVLLEMNSCRVLKLTSCEATCMLFDEQLGGTVPRVAQRHLPKIYKAWGMCAIDYDNKAYWGYEVERLFAAGELATKLCGEQGSPDAANEALREQLKLRYTNEVIALGNMQKYYTDILYNETGIFVPGWQSAIAMANALTKPNSEVETRGAFGYLGKFCFKHKLEFDLRTKGNILFGQDGRLVLADPVTVDMDDDDRAFEGAEIMQRHRALHSPRPGMR